MTAYLVHRSLTIYQTYRVQAETPREALRSCERGYGDLISQDQEQNLDDCCEEEKTSEEV